jgi:hypothetical protein
MDPGRGSFFESFFVSFDPSSASCQAVIPGPARFLDFLPRPHGAGARRIADAVAAGGVQVSLDTAMDATWEREIRSLEVAAAEFPQARPLLITLDPTPPSRVLPGRLEWVAASQWLLEGEEASGH